ncbi:hypothetical protein AAFJ72_14730 [Brevibacillus gelatini]
MVWCTEERGSGIRFLPTLLQRLSDASKHVSYGKRAYLPATPCEAVDVTV